MSEQGLKSKVVGTGLVALDVIIRGSDDREMLPPRAGGTCGNVLAVLSYLGWDAYPIARLAPDTAAEVLLSDLRDSGVHTEFVGRETYGSTPIIVEYLREDVSGKRSHSYSLRCPGCRAYLPSYRPVPLAFLEARSSRLPLAHVFFFDRVSPAATRLAILTRESGGLVVFEPSSVGDTGQFQKAVQLSHVVKYSAERFPDSDVFSRYTEPWLFVETLGAAGLRFRTRLQGQSLVTWHQSNPFATNDVRDTSGAGDWCTAGMIRTLGGAGAAAFSSATLSALHEAFRYAQALASYSCQFEGARGAMYESTPDEVERYASAKLAACTLPQSENQNSQATRRIGEVCLCEGATQTSLFYGSRAM